jgi:hypothetical protein
MKRTTILSLAIAVGLSAVLVGQGSGDWPQFRGPNRNGVALSGNRIFIKGTSTLALWIVG